MRSFIGWVPNVVGRLSFSRIGDHRSPKTLICNALADDDGRILFGVARRKSRTALPAFVAHLFGIFPLTDFAFFLNVEDGTLPFPKAAGGDGDSEDGCDVVLRPATRAALVGRVYFLNGWGMRRGGRAFRALNFTRDQALRARSSRASADTRVKFAVNAEREILRSWSDLHGDLQHGRATPQFGCAEIKLARTGACEVTVDESGVQTSFELKALATGIETPPEWTAAVENALFDAAEQIYFCIRDLTHRHYHHAPHGGGVMTTISEVKSGSDAHWRERTLEGLLRMAIAARRQGTAVALRQALGVVAYADAFQRHFASWCMGDHGVASRAPRYSYDFTALKGSIEANLKARENEDTTRRTRLVFAFGTVITALTLIIPAYRNGGAPSALFGEMLGWIAKNPIIVLPVAFIIGLSVDSLLTLAAVRGPLRAKVSDLMARAYDHAQALPRSLPERFRPGARLTQVSVIIGCLLGLLGLSFIGYAIYLDLRDVPGLFSGMLRDSQ